MDYIASLLMVLKALGIICLILFLCVVLVTFLFILWALIKTALENDSKKKHEKNKA